MNADAKFSKDFVDAPAATAASATAVAIAWVLVGLLALCFGAVVVVLSMAKWRGLGPNLFDLGLCLVELEGAFQHTVPYPDPQYYYAWIYSPYFLLVLPFYAVFRSPLTLVVIHAAALAAALPLLFLLGRRTFSSPWAALCFPLLFVFNPMVSSVIQFGVRGEALWIPILLLGWHFWDTGNRRALTLAAVFASLVKADALPALFAAGLLLELRRDRTGRRLWLIAAVAGAAMLAAAAGVRFIGGQSGRLAQFHLSGLTGSWADYLASFRQEALTLGQWLFLPLLAPEALFLGIVAIAYTVITGPSFFQIPEVRGTLLFDSPLMPHFHTEYTYLTGIYFLAFVIGVRRLHGWGAQFFRGRGKSANWLQFVFAGTLLTAGAAMYLAYTPREMGPAPFTRSFDAAYYCESDRARSVWAALDQLPADKTGVMSWAHYQRIWNNLAARRLKSGPEKWPDYSYALFDLEAYIPEMPKTAYLGQARAALASGLFRVDSFENGVLFLVRGKPSERNQETLRWLDDNDARLASVPRPLSGADRHPDGPTAGDGAPVTPNCARGLLLWTQRLSPRFR